MAARLKEAFGTEVELIPEGRGIFDVKVDGALVYSKFETGEFPDEDALLKQLLS